MSKTLVKRLINFVSNSIKDESELLAIGSVLSKQQYLLNSKNINDYEFKISSQWGDDGIIQYLIKNIRIKNELFIEFGVQNYLESNTRFLMMNNNWSGFIMDGSVEDMDSIKKRNWFWKYGLMYKAVFIDKDNINGLLASTGFSDIGILHIDIDGNDYHILNEIELSILNPSLIIMEYNSVFGKDRAITIPYDKLFIRTHYHYSNLYFGASLSALNYVANKKGYSLICCNKAGNNAYFIRKDLLNEKIVEMSVEEAYKESKFRESRDKNYNLSYVSGNARLQLLKGIEVLNVITNKIETL